MAEKKTLVDVFISSFRNLMAEEINICLPGVITEATDFKKKKVTVQPQISKVYEDGDILDLKPITDVPLVILSTPNMIIKPPKSELIGAGVMLNFSQRSLENWLLKGEIVTPGSNTKFSQRDCFATLGLSSFKEDHSQIEDNDDLEIIYKGQKITIKDDGDIDIGSTSLRKLISEDFRDVYDNHVHNFTAAPSGAFATSTPAQVALNLTPGVAVGGPLAAFFSSIRDSDLTDKVTAQ